MDLLHEIRNGLANLPDHGALLKLNSLPDPFAAWVFREGDTFGVAVQVPEDVCVAERFAGARLVTVKRVFSGELHSLLRLESSNYALRNEFAVVCAQMVSPGENGVLRNDLVADPHGWWQNWRQLLGNAVVDTTAYSVLGELLAMEHLVNNKIEAGWNGPAAGSVDIETPAAWYEVKSTLTRYNMQVHISGHFQLAAPAGKQLYLVHQRFEPASTGLSVDIVTDRLVALGQKREKIERMLAKCGLEAGCSARAEPYKLLDSQLFEVDGTFPKITQESFVGCVLPPSIVRLEYVVDLSGLKHKAFCQPSTT
jgi:hypothetical protein